MAKTYGVNMADKHLVVGSIEVLNDISGNGVKQLQNKIEAVQQQQAFTPAPVNYWSELVSDGIISPIEKKTIKTQWDEIAVVKAQLQFEAEEQEKTEEVTWRLYVGAYNALYNYLFQTLKLFDDMTVSSPVEDRELFNGYFSTYYGKQSAAQILLTQGEPGRVRTLKNLHEAGYDGEVAMYNSWFYIYNDTYQQWESVPNDEYLGVCSSEPKSRAKNQYFLSNNSFITSTSLLMLNKKVILAGNKMLKVSYKATPGNIYVWDGKRWTEDEDRNSYRYLVATNDIITNGGQVSPNIETLIKGAAGTTGYLGMFAADPDTPPFNSYYVYIGITTDTRINGTIYIYKSKGWESLDPNKADNYGYYMKTLKDTLSSTAVNVGTFSTLFCNVLAANQAFITSLFTQQLTLLSNGFIQSQGFAAGSKGFKIEAGGHAEFNDITLGGSAKVNTANNVGSSTPGTFGEIRQMVLAGNSDQEIALKSDNWQNPTSAQGFGIYKNGNAYFQNGLFRGAVVCTSLGVENQVSVGDHLTLKSDGSITATDVDITGKIKATEGEFSGELKAATGTFNGDITGANGTFSGSINADTAKFNKGIECQYIYINDLGLSELHNQLSNYEKQAIYSANGYFCISDFKSIFNNHAEQFSIINIVYGNGFIAINGYSKNVKAESSLQLVGDLQRGYYLTGGVDVYSDGYAKVSVIDVNGSWYYYKGHNVDLSTFSSTGSLSSTTKIDISMTY